MRLLGEDFDDGCLFGDVEPVVPGKAVAEDVKPKSKEMQLVSKKDTGHLIFVNIQV